MLLGTTLARMPRRILSAIALSAALLAPAGALAQTQGSMRVFKEADAVTVPAGKPIGFTVHVVNLTSGEAADGVSLTDALPGGNAGTPVHWVIDKSTVVTTGGSTDNPSLFVITGADGSQQLALAGQPVSVPIATAFVAHVTAETSATSCGTYQNTASVASLGPTVTASAQTGVVCPVPTLSPAFLLGLATLVGAAGWIALTRR